MRSFGIVVVFVLVFEPSLAASQGNTPPEQEVIRSLREAIFRYRSLDLQATAHIRFPSGENETADQTSFINVKRLDSRALISTKDVVNRPGKDTWRRQSDFVVYDTGEVLACQAKIDSSLKQVEGREGLSFRLYSRQLAGTQKQDRRTIYFVLNDAGAALWIIGYSPLLDYLDRASELEVVMNDDGGAEIHATGEYGRVKLKVSDSSGWLPQSFEIVKNPEHKTIGGLVTEVYQDPVSAVVWTGEVAGFTTDSEGRWAPTAMNVQRTTNWKEKPAETTDTAIRFERITFDPPLTASDFQTDIVAPPGYQMTVMGAPHLPYKWDGETAVPGIPDLPPRPNQVVSSDIEDSESSGRTLTFLVVFNVLLIAAIVAVVALKKSGVFR